GWPRFSRDGTPEGSQPAFAARGSCPWGGTHPLSDRLPIGVGLFPHPFSAASSAFFTVRLPRGGSQRAYFVHLLHQHPGFRSCLSAGGASSATGDVSAPQCLTTYRFGPSLSASLACRFLRP